MFTDQELLTKTGLTQASPFQVDIFRHTADQIAAYKTGGRTESLVVEAVAGSGKTTTIVGMARLFQGMNVLFLAFNKAIAEELAERLPKNVSSRTLNSLGFRIWANYARSANRQNVNVDGFKTHKLMRDMYSRNIINDYGDHVRFLVAMCKSLGVVPADVDGIVAPNGLTDSNEDLLSIADNFGHLIKYQDRPTVFRMVREVLKRSIREENNVDFDDQKYLPVVRRVNGKPIECEKFDAIFIDEVQDVNAVDIGLIQMALKENGIVVGVGDTNQAIYGFRGADTSAVEKFRSTFGAKSLPLSITYRCSTSIVEHAQSLVPTIQAAPGAPEGAVQTLGSYTPATFQPGDLVICRNNAPTVEFAFNLIRNKVRCYIKGRDLGKRIRTQIENLAGTEVWEKVNGRKKKVVKFDNITVSELSISLNAWREQQAKIILDENPDDQAKVDWIDDQVRTIRVFIEMASTESVDDVVNNIEKFFSDDDEQEGMVCISTIHKSKGLEADRVFILDQDLLYKEHTMKVSWMAIQEKNLDYVARTRARNALFYIQSDSVG